MNMEDKLDLVLSKLEALESGQNTIYQEVAEIKKEVAETKKEVVEIKKSVFRLEESQPQDIMALMERLERKVDTFRMDVEFIAEKQSIQDLKINRIEKQIQS
ncbi:hypothetical protein [Brevibacillus borstelensis]|uniref:hypothetical protein n=1 Tax=Brevibacillus borstelensis TaxID=45462 RepID=UPI0030BA651D